MTEMENWGVGKNANANSFATTRLGFASGDGEEMDLILGEHPHSRSENNTYARLSSGEIVAFSGHRVHTKIEIETHNRYKSSYLSGDEIRGSVVARIYFNGEQVYSTSANSMEYLMNKASALVTELLDHSSNIALGKAELIGRKIYWNDTPAIIKYVHDDGGITIVPDGDMKFKAPVWWEGEWEEYATSLSTNILSPNIWWFRD